MDEALNLVHAVNGRMYRPIWYWGGYPENQPAKAICDDCMENGVWPEHWPSGYWNRVSAVSEIRKCRFCGGRMKTLEMAVAESARWRKA